VSKLENERNDNTGKLLKKHIISKSKYHYVILFLNDGTKTIRTISRLVACAFLPIPKEYLKEGYTSDTLDVDHVRDDDPLNHEDDTVYNLQWLTHRENIKKAQKAGLYVKWHVKGTKHPEWGRPGESNPTSKYSEKTVKKICKALENNKLTIVEIADKYKVPRDLVYDIKRGKTWVYISKNYNVKNHDKVIANYTTEFLKTLDDLIMQNKTNDEIRKELGMKTNKTTTALISAHRKRLGKKNFTQETYPKETLMLMDSMILDHKSNKEIKETLKLKNCQRTDVLLCAHRRKMGVSASETK
jgi:hypothetical protein